jgi:hypothetical protein
MTVSFGRTAYVTDTENSILDKIGNHLSVSLTGEGTVVVTRESVEEFLKSYKENMEYHEQTNLRTLKDFLYNALESIDKINTGDSIGDIFFTN